MKKQLDETTPTFTEYGMNYTFIDDYETQSSESTEDCIAKYSVIIDKIVNNTDLKKSHIELFKAWTGCHKEFLSKHDKDCFDALESSIPHCEKSAIQMTSDIMGQHPQTNHTISSIRKMSRSLVSNLIPTQKQFKRSTEVSTIATEENLPTFHPTSEQSQNSIDKMATTIKNDNEVNLLDKKLENPTAEQSQNSAVDMGRSRGELDKKLANPTSVQPDPEGTTTEQSQNSAVDMSRSRGQPDKKLANPISVQPDPEGTATEQSQNSAVDMGRASGQPDKKLAKSTSVQSHNSAADRGWARGAAQMPPGSIDLFKIKST